MGPPSSCPTCASRIRESRRDRKCTVAAAPWTLSNVLTTIAEKGGRAIALEADLGDVGSSARLFDAAEAAFGPVDISINNATGWRADTFSPTPQERFGHQQVRVSPETIDQQSAVDARASALLI